MSNSTNQVNAVDHTPDEEYRVPQDPWAYVYAALSALLVLSFLGSLYVGLTF